MIKFEDKRKKSKTETLCQVLSKKINGGKGIKQAEKTTNKNNLDTQIPILHDNGLCP